VEFTFVVIVLLLVVFAGVEFDRMVLVYTTISNSAHAGVRYAITHGSDRTGSCSTYSSDQDKASGPSANPACVIAVVQGFAKTGALNTSYLAAAASAGSQGVYVQYPSSSNARGNKVKVTVTYPYDPFTVLPLSVNLTAEAEGIITW
jgi:Flp pilus assembly protein TadG